MVPSGLAEPENHPVSSGTRAAARQENRNPKSNYYEYYKKLYVINKVLELKIHKLMAERDDLNKKINEVRFVNKRYVRVISGKRKELV